MLTQDSINVTDSAIPSQGVLFILILCHTAMPASQLSMKTVFADPQSVSLFKCPADAEVTRSGLITKNPE